MWLSLVERLVRDQEVGCSSHLTPTRRELRNPNGIFFTAIFQMRQMLFFYWRLVFLVVRIIISWAYSYSGSTACLRVTLRGIRSYRKKLTVKTDGKLFVYQHRANKMNFFSICSFNLKICLLKNTSEYFSAITFNKILIIII